MYLFKYAKIKEGKSLIYYFTAKLSNCKQNSFKNFNLVSVKQLEETGEARISTLLVNQMLPMESCRAPHWHGCVMPLL